jgi:hypothetical protein
MGAAKDAGKDGEYGVVLPWLMAVVDPNEKWWKRLRRTRSGRGSFAGGISAEGTDDGTQFGWKRARQLAKAEG